MLSSGGTCTIETACEVPIRLVESGPAGGAAAAAHYARDDRARRGSSPSTWAARPPRSASSTTASPQITREFEVARVWRFKRGSGLPLLVPVVELIEIGAGGGSIAHVDRMGLPKVGPESAGSEPGPACYGRGGERPDRHRRQPAARLPRRRLLPRRRHAARPRPRPRRRSADHVGEPLGLALEAAAWGIHAIVTENMANAALMHAVERGKEIEGYDLYAFGGAAPMHVVHRSPSGSASGRRRPARRRRAVVLRVPRLAAGLRGRALASAPARGRRPRTTSPSLLERSRRTPGRRSRWPAWPAAEVTRAALVEMRYRGQGYELEVPLPGRPTPGLAGRPRPTAFESVYRRCTATCPVGPADGGRDVAGARPVAGAGAAAAFPASGGRGPARRASAGLDRASRTVPLGARL